MPNRYKLSPIQTNFILIVGILLSSYSLYFIAQDLSLLVLAMGGCIIALSFIHRSRCILVISKESIRLSPTFWHSKEILCEEITGIRTYRGKLIVSSEGKVKELSINLSAFSNRDRIDLSSKIKALQPVNRT